MDILLCHQFHTVKYDYFIVLPLLDTAVISVFIPEDRVTPYITPLHKGALRTAACSSDNPATRYPSSSRGFWLNLLCSYASRLMSVFNCIMNIELVSPYIIAPQVNRVSKEYVVSVDRKKVLKE